MRPPLSQMLPMAIVKRTERRVGQAPDEPVEAIGRQFCTSLGTSPAPSPYPRCQYDREPPEAPVLIGIILAVRADGAGNYDAPAPCWASIVLGASATTGPVRPAEASAGSGAARMRPC